MKKPYLKPVTEGVHVKLFGSVLGGLGGNETGSYVNDWGGGKQNDFDWDDDDNGFMPDLWGDDEEENL